MTGDRNRRIQSSNTSDLGAQIVCPPVKLAITTAKQPREKAITLAR